MAEEPTFPLAPEITGFDPKGAPVEAGAALDWLAAGWRLFVRQPGPWLGLGAAWFGIVFVLFMMPVFGQLVFNLLFPLFAAGFLLAARTASETGHIELRQLFAGFQRNPGPLFLVGVHYCVGLLLVLGLMALIGGAAALGGALLGHTMGMGMAMGGLLFAMVAGLVLAAPLYLALAFAPALVFFHDMAPFPALRASLLASLKSPAAMLVFGLASLLIMALATLPMGLGLIVAAPVLFAALHAAYRAIFFSGVA